MEHCYSIKHSRSKKIYPKVSSKFFCLNHKIYLLVNRLSSSFQGSRDGFRILFLDLSFRMVLDYFHPSNTEHIDIINRFCSQKGPHHLGHVVVVRIMYLYLMQIRLLAHQSKTLEGERLDDWIFPSHFPCADSQVFH